MKKLLLIIVLIFAVVSYGIACDQPGCTHNNYGGAGGAGGAGGQGGMGGAGGNGYGGTGGSATGGAATASTGPVSQSVSVESQRVVVPLP